MQGTTVNNMAWGTFVNTMACGASVNTSTMTCIWGTSIIVDSDIYIALYYVITPVLTVVSFHTPSSCISKPYNLPNTTCGIASTGWPLI